MKLFRPSHRIALLLAGIESGLLVRVLAIAQRLLLCKCKRQILRFFLTDFLSKIGGNVRIVGGGVAEHLGGQTAARLQGGVAMGLQFLQHCGIVGVIDDHGHESMVLGRAAQHGGTADVDVLDGILKRGTLFLDGLFERVKVHHHHVDGGDAVGFHLLDMLGVRTHGEQSAVHLRMQGFHPAVHDFREARHLADADGLHARGLQRLAGAAGGDDCKTQFHKLLRERHHAFLVAYADNRSFHTIYIILN